MAEGYEFLLFHPFYDFFCCTVFDVSFLFPFSCTGNVKKCKPSCDSYRRPSGEAFVTSVEKER